MDFTAWTLSTLDENGNFSNEIPILDLSVEVTQDFSAWNRTSTLNAKLDINSNNIINDWFLEPRLMDLKITSPDGHFNFNGIITSINYNLSLNDKFYYDICWSSHEFDRSFLDGFDKTAPEPVILDWKSCGF